MVDVPLADFKLDGPPDKEVGDSAVSSIEPNKQPPYVVGCIFIFSKDRTFYQCVNKHASDCWFGIFEIHPIHRDVGGGIQSAYCDQARDCETTL